MIGRGNQRKAAPRAPRRILGWRVSTEMGAGVLGIGTCKMAAEKDGTTIVAIASSADLAGRMIRDMIAKRRA